MKNILIIPPFNPYPLVSGGHQAIFNGIAILKDVANVYMITPVTESQYKRKEHNAILAELPFVHVIPFILPGSKHNLTWYWKVFKNKLKKYAPKLKASLENSIPNVETSYSFRINDWIGDTYGEEIRLVQKTIKTYHIDIVQCEMIPTLTLCDCIPNSVKKIFVHHELRYVRNELLLKQHQEASKELLDEVRTDRENEIRYLNKYDEIITLSEVDTQKLREVGVTVPICTSFAVVRDLPQLHPALPSQKRIVFIGPEFHAPNREGVMWFLKHCWNDILSYDSSYQFDIIGKWSDETALMLANTYQRVTCLGFVDDLHSAMDGATMIVPILVGSGIRMKILESAQWGVPIVTTSVGAEGLPLENEKHVYLADTPEQFVKAIIAFEDNDKRRVCTQAILTDILPKYSLSALKTNRLNSYQ